MALIADSAATGVRGSLRGLLASARLGWAVSSNWTRPSVFAIYSVLRPVSGALILAVMYRVVAGEAATPYLAFLITGTAFWGFVIEAMSGFAIAVTEDRGRYRMLKYVYISGPRFPLFLLGRAAAQTLTAVASVAITLVVATLLLHLPLSLSQVDWPLLLASLLLVSVPVLSLAIAFAVWLLSARDSYGYADVAAQSMYILSGAIFPISVLPGVLHAVAAASPLAYWLECVRRALLPGQDSVLMFGDLSTAAVLGRLLLFGALWTAAGAALYRVAERLARRRGLIDRETNA